MPTRNNEKQSHNNEKPTRNDEKLTRIDKEPTSHTERQWQWPNQVYEATWGITMYKTYMVISAMSSLTIVWAPVA